MDECKPHKPLPAAIALTVEPAAAAAAIQGLTLVHFSAQPEPFLTQNTP